MLNHACAIVHIFFFFFFFMHVPCACNGTLSGKAFSDMLVSEPDPRTWRRVWF